MTSMRRHYVALTSLRRHVPAGNLAPPPPGPPKILNLAPPPPPPPPPQYSKPSYAYEERHFFHASSDSFSQIDYFLVGPSRSRLQCTVKIPEMHHLNLSDHTNIEIRISTAASYIQAPTMKGSTPGDVLRPRIKWTNCDLGRYKAAVRQGLQHIFPVIACTLDADLT